MTAIQGVRAELRRLRALRPDWSLTELGLAVGVSRQRVHQLLKAEGLPTRSILPSSAWARRRYYQVEAEQALETEQSALGETSRARSLAYLQALGILAGKPGGQPGGERGTPGASPGGGAHG